MAEGPVADILGDLHDGAEDMNSNADHEGEDGRLPCRESSILVRRPSGACLMSDVRSRGRFYNSTTVRS